MKQNIILTITLIILFIIGLLIYDFSDNLNSKVYDNNWYYFEDNNLFEMSFKNNVFSYKNVTKNKDVEKYKDCKTFRFNRNINVIKLNCVNDGNKIFVEKVSDNTLNIEINDKKIELFSSVYLLNEDLFKLNNNLSDKEYNKLLNYDFSKYSFINKEDIESLVKDKELKYLVIFNKNVDYTNISNFVALDRIKKNNFYYLNALDLDDEGYSELLDKYNVLEKDKTNYDNKIVIYSINEKKVKLYTEISLNSLKEAKEFKVEE